MSKIVECLKGVNLDPIVKEYDRIMEELREKYQVSLLIHFNKQYSPSETAKIVLEKIMYLAKLRFEKDLAKIYKSDESDATMLERQNDLIMCMLYATEMYMTTHEQNRSFRKDKN